MAKCERFAWRGEITRAVAASLPRRYCVGLPGLRSPALRAKPVRYQNHESEMIPLPITRMDRIESSTLETTLKNTSQKI